MIVNDLLFVVTAQQFVEVSSFTRKFMKIELSQCNLTYFMEASVVIGLCSGPLLLFS